MDHIGIDLHKNTSQVCILTEDGELVERRIKTDRESFDKLFGERPLAASSSSLRPRASGAHATSKG
jgi:hypothetical protein